MAEIAERVVGLVAEPSYRPMTLKAMSRHLAIRFGRLPGVSSNDQGLDSRREASACERQNAQPSRSDRR